MGTQTDYFNRIGYKATYQIGDRITGVYRGVRWMGTVGNDFVVSEDEGPKITVHLDLPLVFQDERFDFLFIAKHNDVKLMKEF